MMKQSKSGSPLRLLELNPSGTLEKIGLSENHIVCDIGAGSSKTSFPYEVSIILAIFIYLPIGIIHALFASIKNEPLLKF
ncbi:MAG: hypothetical protein AB7E31_15105 [Desulfitobacterium sp.]